MAPDGKERTMPLQEITIGATLKPDGTLELDEKPSPPPGRVTVVLKQGSESALPKEDWWQFLQRARTQLEASGATFMHEEEIKAHIEWLGEPDQIDELLRQADHERRPGEPS
jgi:hypothetical protein